MSGQEGQIGVICVPVCAKKTKEQRCMASSPDAAGGAGSVQIYKSKDLQDLEAGKGQNLVSVQVQTNKSDKIHNYKIQWMKPPPPK